jgi:lysophospholipase L1-like esterase
VTACLIALGDSFSCGEGVGIRVPSEQTWVGLLTATLGADLICTAQPGATVGSVRREQLPVAVASDVLVATVLVGLNDVSRGGFAAESFEDDLRAVVAALPGPRVLLLRLHDPCLQFPFAASLSGWIRKRVAAVNTAVDAVAALDPRALVLDLDELPGLRMREAWAVDRLHPSRFGHSVIAAAAAELLVGKRQALLPKSAPSRPIQEAAWLVRHALPWTVTKSLPVGRFALRRFRAIT